VANDNLLGIPQTFSHNSNWWTVVSATKLPSLWLDKFTFLCNKLNFIAFLFTWEENLTNFRKFSQEMELTRVKWARYGSLMQRESIIHNSNFFYNSNFFWWSPAVPVIQVLLYKLTKDSRYHGIAIPINLINPSFYIGKSVSICYIVNNDDTMTSSIVSVKFPHRVSPVATVSFMVLFGYLAIIFNKNPKKGVGIIRKAHSHSGRSEWLRLKLWIFRSWAQHIRRGAIFTYVLNLHVVVQLILFPWIRLFRPSLVFNTIKAKNKEKESKGAAQKMKPARLLVQ